MSVVGNLGQSQWTNVQQHENCGGRTVIQPPLTAKERRLQKLIRLAERPGTPEEGRAAQRFIDRFMSSKERNG